MAGHKHPQAASRSCPLCGGTRRVIRGRLLAQLDRREDANLAVVPDVLEDESEVRRQGNADLDSPRFEAGSKAG